MGRRQRKLLSWFLLFLVEQWMSDEVIISSGSKQSCDTES